MLRSWRWVWVAVVVAWAAAGWAAGEGAAEGPMEAAAPDWAPRLMTASEAEEGFYPLFNGRDLDGWRIRGENKSAFDVKDEMLVTTGAGGGDWIFTTREYENFVLRYEYRVFKRDDNSGVAIRALPDGNPAFSGMEIQVLHPEPEPGLNSSGALYASVKPAVAADKAFGEWNEVEIFCDGPRIRTTMNGQVLYDINIDTFESPDKQHTPLKERARYGFIALQDYGKYVEFRRLRLKPLPGGAGWHALFDGVGLGGWKASEEGVWAVDPGGVIRSAFPGGGRAASLQTTVAYWDFELRFSFKATGGAKGAVLLRGRDADAKAGASVCLDNHDLAEFTGALAGQMPATELRARDDCWAQVHVIADGANYQVAVNGKTVADYITSNYKDFRTGWVALERRGPEGAMLFKDIEVKPLPTRAP